VKKKTVVLSSALAAVLVLGGGGAALAAGVGRDDVTADERDRAADAALAEVGDGTVTEVDDLDDGLAGYEVEVTRADGREVVVLLDDAFTVSSSRVDDSDDRGDSDDRDDAADDRGGDRRDGDDDSDDRGDDSVAGGTDASGTPGTGDDAPVSAEERTRAADAAVTAAGGGTVTDVDRSDDADHAWDVDVQRADGTEVEVDLDASFGVVRTEVDDQR